MEKIKRMMQTIEKKSLSRIRGGQESGCVCSPGGKSYGTSSTAGCACGCPNGIDANYSANKNLAS